MRSLPAAALLGLALIAAVPSGAPQESDQGSADGSGPALTVLLFHPNDGVDPLGFAAPGSESDPFALRYGPLVADKGRFDFPFYVADGVLPIEAIPDPAKPFASALAAYAATVEQRAAEEAPAALRLDSIAPEGQVAVQVQVLPRADLAGEDLRLRLALVEDHVEYQPPPGLTNGITDHRFTVRSYADLGRVTEANLTFTASFPLPDGWARDQMSIAAWLQQDSPSPRFDAREVVQATHAPLGRAVEQASKGVLVEMLSATWCDPCLYGDRAVEQLAVDYGVAEPGPAAPESRYLDLARRDLAAVAVAALLALGLVALARRQGE